MAAGQALPWAGMLANQHREAYLVGMDDFTRSHPGAPSAPDETAEARQQRLAWEAEQIAEAEAEVAAGQTISLSAVRAWVESWNTDHELPPPEPGQ